MMMSPSFSKILILLISLIFSVVSLAGEALWIDVRTAQEFNTGHVSQAVNIPYEEIAGRIDGLTEDKDAPIYVYCRSGRRSGIAKATLEEAGYSNVTNLGGLEEAQDKAAEVSVH